MQHAQPHALSSNLVGVGACLWDSSFVLTAFLGAHMCVHVVLLQMLLAVCHYNSLCSVQPAWTRSHLRAPGWLNWGLGWACLASSWQIRVPV